MHEAVDADAALALDDGPDGAVLELHDLGDLGDGADGVQLGRVADVLLLGLALGHERDRATGLGGGVQRRDALLAPHLERDDHLREDDRLPERDERQLTELRRAGRALRLLLRVGRSLGHQGLLGLPAGSGRRRFGCGCRWVVGGWWSRGAVRTVVRSGTRGAGGAPVWRSAALSRVPSS